MSPEQLNAASEEVAASKLAQGIVKKQKPDGAWGGNLLGLAPSTTAGIKDVGTIPQYRRLLQIGYPRSGRPFKLADRLLFRILSRDEDASLLYEYQKAAKANPLYAEWFRDNLREAATCALAEAGYQEDPRIRGSAHRIASGISAFLRSPLAEKPLIKQGSGMILNPEAHPPTWYTLAMVAVMPNLQRERAGFIERLGQYLGQPSPKKSYSIKLGKKTLKPDVVLLGCPIEADSKGGCSDIPLALHFADLLAQIGALQTSPIAVRVLSRLYSECDERGVWHPTNLRSVPKGIHRITGHTFPLHDATSGPDGKAVDVTLRLAILAKRVGMTIEVT